MAPLAGPEQNRRPRNRLYLMERKTIADIHFSVHSVLVDWELKSKFYCWVAGDSDDYVNIDWLSSPISKTEFPDNISWQDVIGYVEGFPFNNRSLSGTEGEILRLLRMETAERLFDRFLHEGLDAGSAKHVEDEWNERFNSFEPKFDYYLKGFSGRFDGKDFVFHEQQEKGFAFLCTKGNGLLAYDVGVGKTATGIAAVVHQMQVGKCLRPLIVVPKAVYPKWLHDTKELFPDIPVNELENLNKEVIDSLMRKSGLLLAKNVFFLTATPFTNSPMEIYSMLLFVGGREIGGMGFRHINDFLNEFAEIKLEWTVNNKNQVVQKTVMKNFRSLYALQQIIQNYIDKVDADDANIKRPEKETPVLNAAR